MKKRRFIVAVALVVALGALTFLVLQMTSGPPEPSYEGKKLSEWLLVFDATNTASETDHQAAHDAIIAMGTNSIPYLLRILEPESPLETWFRKAAESRSWMKALYAAEPVHYSRVLVAWEILGPQGKDAVPRLIALYGRTSSPSAKIAICHALGEIGPDAKAAVPSLIRGAREGSIASGSALLALGHIRSQPEQVVPVLVKYLQSPDRGSQSLAISSLYFFGPGAKAAVPALLKYLEQHPPEKEGRGLGVEAADALKSIDPKTAGKVLSNRPSLAK